MMIKLIDSDNSYVMKKIENQFMLQVASKKNWKLPCRFSIKFNFYHSYFIRNLTYA